MITLLYKDFFTNSGAVIDDGEKLIEEEDFYHPFIPKKQDDEGEMKEGGTSSISPSLPDITSEKRARSL